MYEDPDYSIPNLSKIQKLFVIIMILIIYAQALEREHQEVVTKLERGQKETISKMRKHRDGDLIQLRDQFLALLHAVDADDDDARHGDAPDDEPNDGRLLNNNPAG